MRQAVLAALALVLFLSGSLQAQKVSIQPIGASAGSPNPPCGDASLSPVIDKAAKIAEGMTRGTVTAAEAKQFIANDLGVVHVGASNCAFTCQLAGPDDSIWFYQNNEPHPWNCGGTFRGEILVEYSGATKIHAKKAGDQYLVCSTFKNWSHTNTFTGEIQAGTEYNWPKQYCPNDPSTNTPKHAFKP
jgi:hypothetical protein